MSIALGQEIALGTVAVALSSAFIAWLSLRVSRHALKLATTDHDDKHRHFSAYLIDGLGYAKTPDQRIVAFACSLSNMATAPLSIVRADLHVYAFDDTGMVSEIILVPASDSAAPFPDLNPLALPLNLAPRATVSGWITYLIPERLSRLRVIDRYELAFLSSMGEQTRIVQYLLRNIGHAAGDI